MSATKLRLASACFGGVALFIPLMVWAARATLSLAGGLFWLGASLTFLSCALQPARLFGNAFGKPLAHTPLTAALNAVSTLLWLLAGLAWLFT